MIIKIIDNNHGLKESLYKSLVEKSELFGNFFLLLIQINSNIDKKELRKLIFGHIRSKSNFFLLFYGYNLKGNHKWLRHYLKNNWAIYEQQPITYFDVIRLFLIKNKTNYNEKIIEELKNIKYKKSDKKQPIKKRKNKLIVKIQTLAIKLFVFCLVGWKEVLK